MTTDPLKNEREALFNIVGRDVGSVVCSFLGQYYFNILTENLINVPPVFIFQFSLDKCFFDMLEVLWQTLPYNDKQHLGPQALMHCSYTGNFQSARWLLEHECTWVPHAFRVFQMKEDYLALHWFSLHNFLPENEQTGQPTTMNYQLPHWKRRRQWGPSGQDGPVMSHP
jgi:hypothetical protein